VVILPPVWYNDQSLSGSEAGSNDETEGYRNDKSDDDDGNGDRNAEREYHELWVFAMLEQTINFHGSGDVSSPGIFVEFCMMARRFVPVSCDITITFFRSQHEDNNFLACAALYRYARVHSILELRFQSN